MHDEGDTVSSDLDLVDVLIVGAGFGGLYALHRARQVGLTARVVEAGEDVGGTWYWNCYPGARCDVESVEYSYGFSEELQQEWVWSERYAGQPEILRYAQHVADRFDLRKDITFRTRVLSAAFDESGGRWRVRLDDGREASAAFFVLATGCLSAANVPDIPGLDTFTGPVLHTGRWPRQEVDFSGQRVGIIGTGSSAIQAVPIIARAAAELVVFQRTASYSIPAHNRPLADPPAQRQAQYEDRWSRGGFAFVGSYGDTSVNMEANTLAAEFVREKIRSIVTDPAVARALCPAQPISCKRIALDSGYYETFNRPNVRLVDVTRQPIAAVDAEGITVGAEHVDLDVLVLATGYDAMTGSYTGIDIAGRQGRSLKEAWSAGPVTFLGLGVPDFPNLFIVAGPGSPSVLTNMVLAVEQHAEWIMDCISYLRRHDLRTIEATSDAAEQWVAHVNELASYTLYPTCNSWYLGANIPGKPRVFMPLLGFPAYEARCDEVAATGYQGFELH